MRIKKDISELLEAEVISPAVAEQIQQYYASTKKPNNWLFVVFGILGSILVGLGIILIVAHNWDDLSRNVKSFLSFIPLLIGQAACVYYLLKKPRSTAWREGAATFVFFAVGAVIALISQIYNMPGNLSGFLFTWMLLCLPLVYVMRSRVVTALYLIGTGAYLINSDGFSTFNFEFWLMIAAVIPFYYYCLTQSPKSKFNFLLNWVLPAVLFLGFWYNVEIFGRDDYQLLGIISMLALLYLIGQLKIFRDYKLFQNGFWVIGFTGTVIQLLACSFDDFWNNVNLKELEKWELGSPSFLSAGVAFISALALLIYHLIIGTRFKKSLMPYAFIIFIAVYFIGLYVPFGMVIINILILLIGVTTLLRGANDDNLGYLNLGLAIVSLLVACRFFDESLSFVVRGVLFVLVGLLFFFSNYWMLKKRRAHEA